MSKMIEIDWNPDRRTLRQFGAVALVGFGILAALAWTESLIFSFGLGAARPAVAGALAGLGVLSALLGLVAPRANRPLFLGVTLLAFPIGFVLSHVILGLLFYVVIAPAGLVLRLAGHDPMQRRWSAEATSYWAPARPPRSKESYFRQY